MSKRKYASRRQLVEIENRIAFLEAMRNFDAADALRSFFSNEPLNDNNIDDYRRNVLDYLNKEII